MKIVDKCVFVSSIQLFLKQKPNTKYIHVTKLVSFLLSIQKTQGGSVGIVLNAIWFEPISSSLEDKLAAERAQSFYMNW